ncbi:hypothetical protein CEXT_375481 [Caerostris extrusa]|uniref:Uncharacterized protein n=1 Tax=Caerostris extrusa TaxID=172846 RepID=A0AAV4NZ26_CAEEX|nr:hypothetical protein CEXT_375481 [Caerostris extrusa]
MPGGGGSTDCLAHNDFLPSSAAGFFPDLPITAIRLCRVHPSVFLEQMSAANDPEEVPPGSLPVFICIELNRGQTRENEWRPSFRRVRLIKTFEVFSEPFSCHGPVWGSATK